MSPEDVNSPILTITASWSLIPNGLDEDADILDGESVAVHMCSSIIVGEGTYPQVHIEKEVPRVQT